MSLSSRPSSLNSSSTRDYGQQNRDVSAPRLAMNKEPQLKEKKGSPDGVDQATSRDQSSGDETSPIKSINRLSVSMPSPSSMYSSNDVIKSKQGQLPSIQFGGVASEDDAIQIDSYNALQMCMSPQNNNKGFMDIRIPKFRFSPDNPFASRNSMRRRSELTAELNAFDNAVVPFKLSNYDNDYDTVRLKYLDGGKRNRRKSF